MPRLFNRHSKVMQKHATFKAEERLSSQFSILNSQKRVLKKESEKGKEKERLSAERCPDETRRHETTPKGYIKRLRRPSASAHSQAMACVKLQTFHSKDMSLEKTDKGLRLRLRLRLKERERSEGRPYEMPKGIYKTAYFFIGLSAFRHGFPRNKE